MTGSRARPAGDDGFLYEDSSRSRRDDKYVLVSVSSSKAFSGAAEI
jgi:hypothetical protein